MLKTIHRNNKFHILFPLILVMGGLSACGDASSPSSFEMEELTDTASESSPTEESQPSEEVPSSVDTNMDTSSPHNPDSPNDTSPPSTDAQKASSSFDTSAQLQFLAQHVDLWTSQEDPYVDFYNYAVTDLNQNGWLELISTICEGTGLYSTNEVWELNETGDDLIHYTRSTLPDEKSQADMLGTPSIPVYFDATANRYYCIFSDLEKNGAAEYYENTRSLVLENGILKDIILAYRTTFYSSDSTKKITCMDPDANIISEEAYEKIASTTYAGFIPMNATLSWFSPQDSTEADGLDSENGSIMAAISQQERLRLLTKSWEDFSMK